MIRVTRNFPIASHRKACLFFLGVSLCALRAGADVLVLKNGDALTGRVVRVNQGVLLFRTTTQAQMAAPMDTVAAVKANDALQITLNDGAVLYGRLIEKEGITYLEPLDGGEAQSLSLADVQEALVIPSTPEPSTDDLKWHGAAGAGILGESDGVGAYGRVAAEKAYPDFVVETEAWLQMDGGDVPRRAAAEIELRSDREASLEPLVALEAERDIENELKIRSGLTLGLGHTISDTGRASLESRFGAYLSYEDWQDESGGIFSRKRAEDRWDLSGALTLRYARSLWGKGTLEQEMRLLPSLTEFGELRGRLRSSVVWPVSGKLQLRFDLLFDYDSAPGSRGADRWRSGVGAGLQMEF